VDAGDPPNPDLPWIPWRILPLADSAEFAACTAAQRLRYNHYYALCVAEQFIWLENELIVAPLKRLMRRGVLAGPVRELFESFLRDEDAHNATLWRLCHAARPDLYPGGNRYPEIVPRRQLFRPPATVRAVAALFAVFPRTLSGWVLMVNSFEEHTLLLHRAYQDAAHPLDPVFRQVHFLHARDEARHCHLDRLLAELLLDSQSPAARTVNGWFLSLAMKRYYDSRWGFEPPIRQWVGDFPELRSRMPTFIEHAGRGRASPGFLAHLFDAESVPLTGRNRERFPIFNRAVCSLTNSTPPRV
jgi:hypothetical protein